MNFGQNSLMDLGDSIEITLEAVNNIIKFYKMIAIIMQ